jgi:hypothetical protein
MATTREGGVYRDADGQGFHNANGEKLDPKEAEAAVETLEASRDAKNKDRAKAASELRTAGAVKVARDGDEEVEGEERRPVRRGLDDPSNNENANRLASGIVGGIPSGPSGTPVQPAGGATSELSREALEDMTKAELEAEAGRRGVTVTRKDGDDGEPLKEDYVRALAPKRSR